MPDTGSVDILHWKKARKANCYLHVYIFNDIYWLISNNIKSTREKFYFCCTGYDTAKQLKVIWIF